MRDEETTRPWEKHYDAERIQVAIETPVLRVLDASFAPGQQVPWHRHTDVVDHFWLFPNALG